jgi:CPA1 family monovalent cation:H+ antiporter
MHHEHLLLLESLFVVTLVAMLAQRLRFPYTTALVVTGLALSYFKVIPDVALPSGIIINLFLPILLFEAAINTDATHLKEDIKPVGLLSTLGFVVMAGVTGALLHFWLSWPWALALLAGTMFSITDTVAVLAVFKSLKVPPRLATLAEGESLFNDGTALVIFKVILAVVLTGTFHPGQALAEILLVAVGGLALGGLIGLLGSWLLARTQDHLTEILLSTLLALGAFFVAETVHVSGVIAVVMAGLVVGNIGWKRSLNPTSQIALGSFWEYAAFGVNSIVFLLVGLSIDLVKLGGSLPAILLAFVAFHIGRLVLIYGSFGLVGRRAERPVPMKWQHLLVWGNIKGSLTMVLALSLPATVPLREELLTITFGVVLLSLVVQGLSLGPVVRALKVTGVSELRRRFEKEQVQLIRGRAAQAEIQKLVDAGLLSKTSHERMRARYQVSIAQAERELRALGAENEAYWDEAMAEVQRRLLLVEKAAVARAAREKLISEEIGEESLAEIDAKLVNSVPTAAQHAAGPSAGPTEVAEGKPSAQGPATAAG